MYEPGDVASLVSIVMFVVLSLMGFLSRPRDVASIAFAVFTAMLAIDTFITFAMHQVTSVAEFRWIMHAAFVVGVLVPAAALFHVLACTGLIFRMRERILGIQIRHYILASAALLLVIGSMFHGIFLVDIERQPGGGFIPKLTRLTVIFVIAAVVLTAITIALLMIKAYRESVPGPRRDYLRANLIGILLIMVPGPVIGILFAVKGVEAQLAIQAFVLVGAVQFYFAINRYQIDRFQELNVGLEAKVDERTRHLQEAQLRLVQSEKTAALGKLVAGVTHEVSTPIGAIVSSADTIDRAVDRVQGELTATTSDATPARLRRVLGVIAESNAVITRSGQRVAQLVDNLKGFVHLDGAEQVEVDLHRSLDATIELLRHELPEGIEVVREYGAIAKVRGNQADLNQVFMHLVRNAGQALHAKETTSKTITVRTAADDHQVRVELSDTGCGIPAERLGELFDLRFSSPRSRIKLGVGLATSRQIVERHGGTIGVESTPAEGTTFTVCLPIKPRT